LDTYSGINSKLAIQLAFQSDFSKIRGGNMNLRNEEVASDENQSEAGGDGNGEDQEV